MSGLAIGGVFKEAFIMDGSVTFRVSIGFSKDGREASAGLAELQGKNVKILIEEA